MGKQAHTHEYIISLIDKKRFVVKDGFRYKSRRLPIPVNCAVCGHPGELSAGSLLKGSKPLPCGGCRTKQVIDFVTKADCTIDKNYTYKAALSVVVAICNKCGTKREFWTCRLLQGKRPHPCYGCQARQIINAVTTADCTIDKNYIFEDTRSFVVATCNKCGTDRRLSVSSLLQDRETRLCGICLHNEAIELCATINVTIKKSVRVTSTIMPIPVTCNKCGNDYEICDIFILRRKCGHNACVDVQNSKGVKKTVAAILESKKRIKLTREYRHPVIGRMSFDIWLPEHNVAIEFDGEQHYKPGFGGKEKLEQTKKLDAQKNKLCRDNNITLIRIPYWDESKISKEYIKNRLAEHSIIL